MGRFSDFKQSFLEVLWIARNTLGTFWFWLPIVYMAYVLFQLWLMFYVHPLTLAILPVIIIIYGMRNEDKRLKARYGLGKTKRLSASQGLGGSPEPVKEFEWKVEQAVDRYEKMLKAEKEEEEKS